MVNQQLLLQNEYLIAENRILRTHLPARLRLSDPQRSTLAEIGKRLGRKALEQVACVAKPDTILAWDRRLVARKFDGSRERSSPGRPPIQREILELIVQMSKENPGWGYDRIVGALANLGHVVSDQTVGNILRRHGLAPAPKRSENTTWKDFIASRMAVLVGVDFFTVEVLTWRGLEPTHFNWLKDPRRAAIWAAKQYLPPPFRDSAFHYQYSGSAGMKAGLRLHFGFWLLDPMSSIDVKRYLQTVGNGKLDLSLYNPVQPHYTADPIFIGIADPLIGRREGLVL